MANEAILHNYEGEKVDIDEYLKQIEGLKQELSDAKVSILFRIGVILSGIGEGWGVEREKEWVGRGFGV